MLLWWFVNRFTVVLWPLEYWIINLRHFDVIELSQMNKKLSLTVYDSKSCFGLINLANEDHLLFTKSKYFSYLSSKQISNFLYLKINIYSFLVSIVLFLMIQNYKPYTSASKCILLNCFINFFFQYKWGNSIHTSRWKIRRGYCRVCQKS